MARKTALVTRPKYRAARGRDRCGRRPGTRAATRGDADRRLRPWRCACGRRAGGSGARRRHEAEEGAQVGEQTDVPPEPGQREHVDTPLATPDPSGSLHAPTRARPRAASRTQGLETCRQVNHVEGGSTHVQPGEDADETDLPRAIRGKRNLTPGGPVTPVSQGNTPRGCSQKIPSLQSVPSRETVASRSGSRVYRSRATVRLVLIPAGIGSRAPAPAPATAASRSVQTVHQVGALHADRQVRGVEASARVSNAARAAACIARASRSQARSAHASAHEGRRRSARSTISRPPRPPGGGQRRPARDVRPPGRLRPPRQASGRYGCAREHRRERRRRVERIGLARAASSAHGAPRAPAGEAARPGQRQRGREAQRAADVAGARRASTARRRRRAESRTRVRARAAAGRSRRAAWTSSGSGCAGSGDREIAPVRVASPRRRSRRPGPRRARTARGVLNRGRPSRPRARERRSRRASGAPRRARASRR